MCTRAFNKPLTKYTAFTSCSAWLASSSQTPLAETTCAMGDAERTRGRSSVEKNTYNDAHLHSREY